MPPLIDQRVRNVYIALATDVENRRKSVAWIIDAAEKRLQKMRNPPRVPGKSWAYDFVPKILKRLGIKIGLNGLGHLGLLRTHVSLTD
jgi:hypothetical protein